MTANILLNHVASILDLIQRCLKDEDRTDATMRLSYGLIGDLADTFSQGQIRSLLLSPWIANELRTKYKMPGETKKTMRWAREVSVYGLIDLMLLIDVSGGAACR